MFLFIVIFENNNDSSKNIESPFNGYVELNKLSLYICKDLFPVIIEKKKLLIIKIN